MFKLGLKIWSVNENYYKEAIRLYEKGVCQFIELFSVPDSFNKYASLWKTLDIPYIIHAPHFNQGMNLAKQEHFENNMKLAAEALRFADELNASMVIFHAGANGIIQETARQLKSINDQRIVVENKPYYGSRGHEVWKDITCNGYSPQDIAYVMQESGVGFCFDIEHAVTAANAINIDKMEFVKSFLALKPKLFHITDGDWNGIYDQHKHLGQGDFKFDQILSLYPTDCMITLESVHDFKDRLDDFELDIAHLREIEKKLSENIIVRPAQITDVRDIFELANDPVVRKNSFLSEKILWEDHESWFTQKINDPQTIFYVVKNQKDNVIGYVRFDPENEFEHRISINLAHNYRGKGFGKKIIELATLQVINNGLIKTVNAYIKEENIPSLKSFEKAGYRHAGITMKHDISCLVMKYEKGL